MSSGPTARCRTAFPATVEEIVLKWDAVKKAEKPERGHVPSKGIPPRLPALARAQKFLDRAERAPDSGHGELERNRRMSDSRSRPEEELGDLLLAVVGCCPGQRDSTPNVPFAAPSGGSRTAGPAIMTSG